MKKAMKIAGLVLALPILAVFLGLAGVAYLILFGEPTDDHEHVAAKRS